MSDSASDLDAVLKDINQSTDWPGMQRFYRKAATIGAEAAIPALGGAGALKYGSKAIPPMARQIGGTLGGVAANQMTGITKPGPMEYVTNALIPFGSGVTRRSIPFLSRFGTPTTTAETLNALVPKESKLLASQYKPSVGSDVLFKKLEKEKAQIPVPAMKKATKDVGKTIEKSAFPKKYRHLKEDVGLARQATSKTGWIPVDRYQQMLHDVGKELGRVEAQGGTEAFGYGKMYHALMKDLDKAPSRIKSDVGERLATARDTFQREQVIEEIKTLANPKALKGSDIETSNAARIINKLHDEDTFIGHNFHTSFSPKEQKDILEKLRQLNRMSQLAPSGHRLLSEELAGVVSGGAAGSYAGHGSELGLPVGAAVGAAIPPSVRMWNAFNLANNTQAGRAMIGQMYQEANWKMTPQIWAAIEAYAAAMGGADPSAGLSTMVGRK